jgi:pimeloyl-ACP methyl ester carboxylesterase
MMAACGMAYADYGFGQSASFNVNLLAASGASNYGSANSGSFNVNLMGIRRAYADSDSFNFDWLANSQPMSGPFRCPASPPQSDTLEQYNSATNQWVAPFSFPDTGQPVIVLNFGWNSNSDTLLALASAISNRLPGVYIYTWDWANFPNDPKGDANPNEKSTVADFALFFDWFNLYGGGNINQFLAGDNAFERELIACMTNAAKQGMLLGNSLFAHGIRPDRQNIHLIGSSFGGIVSAQAAETLRIRTGSKVKQITTLDTPALYLPYAIDYVKPESAERVEVLYYNCHGVAWNAFDAPTVGLAMGATGGPLISSASNILNFQLNPWYYNSFIYFPLHFRAVDWYLESVNASALNCDGNPYGFGWSALLNPLQCNNWPLGNKAETMGGRGCLTPIAELGVEAGLKMVDKAKDEFTSANTWLTNQFVAAWDEEGSSGLYVTTPMLLKQNLMSANSLSEYGKTGFVALDEGADPNIAYIYKDITVPSDAELVFFDYRFVSYNPGDTLSLSMDNNTPLVIDAEVEGTSQRYKTSLPVYVGDYAGRTITLQFTLRSAGTGSTQLYIDNLRFVAITLAEDINGDKVINIADLMALSQHWLEDGCDYSDHCSGADISGDGKVDFVDLARLASQWQ